VKALCDVHLPQRLVIFFSQQDIEAIHGSTILQGWKTKDSEFCAYADANDCVMITKDNDFRNSHFLENTPLKLIKVSLGNISNDALISIFQSRLSFIKTIFDEHECAYIEINKDSVNVLIH